MWWRAEPADAYRVSETNSGLAGGVVLLLGPAQARGRQVKHTFTQTRTHTFSHTEYTLQQLNEDTMERFLQ